MNTMKLTSLGGYQSMGKETIVVSSASWRFIAPWISDHMSRERSFPTKRIKLKHHQGDIFMLQLRGHIDVA